MRIAFTHNLQITANEEEAEFDRIETVEDLASAMRRLGHEVELVEVSGPASRIVARLEALSPDIIFNTAEGRVGRYREAFYPGLFEQLLIPYTGSDAYVCTLTLDKHLTKLAVAQLGVPTPKWFFVDDPNRIAIPPDIRLPVIVKPNFEGSSKGITEDSIVEEWEFLEEKIRRMLTRYPSGLLVEEFIHGRDVVIPFLEKASPTTGGVLAAGEYKFDPGIIGQRKYNIYDYPLKHVAYNAVSIQAPADIAPPLAERLTLYSQRIYKALGVRDLGRIDFRLSEEGEPYFLEINALPSLEPGAGIYVSAALADLKTIDSVLDAILRSAAERQNVRSTSSAQKRRRPALRVGLAYNLKRIVARQEGDDDSEAEYDPPSTIEAIRDAITSYGHEIIMMEATPDLFSMLPMMRPDVVFNIAEGVHGRNRESQVPSLLELLEIPYTGSDPATLAIALDKVLAKRIVRQAGILTPNFAVLRTGKERIPKELRFPAIIKPIAEGSSKGVGGANVVRSEEELRQRAGEMIGRYRQAMLVEEFLTGREFTVAMLGENRPKVLPPMEIVFNMPQVEHPIYGFEHKLRWNEEIHYEVPAKVDRQLALEIERVSRGVFSALGCRDIARIDLRIDRDQRVNFIECNPLPGLTPKWSDLCLIAEAAGMDYRTLIGEILAPAIRRFRERERGNRGGAGMPFAPS